MATNIFKNVEQLCKKHLEGFLYYQRIFLVKMNLQQKDEKILIFKDLVNIILNERLNTLIKGYPRYKTKNDYSTVIHCEDQKDCDFAIKFWFLGEVTFLDGLNINLENNESLFGVVCGQNMKNHKKFDKLINVWNKLSNLIDLNSHYQQVFKIGLIDDGDIQKMTQQQKNSTLIKLSDSNQIYKFQNKPLLDIQMIYKATLSPFFCIQGDNCLNKTLEFLQLLKNVNLEDNMENLQKLNFEANGICICNFISYDCEYSKIKYTENYNLQFKAEFKKMCFKKKTFVNFQIETINLYCNEILACILQEQFIPLIALLQNTSFENLKHIIYYSTKSITEQNLNEPVNLQGQTQQMLEEQDLRNFQKYRPPRLGIQQCNIIKSIEKLLNQGSSIYNQNHHQVFDIFEQECNDEQKILEDVEKQYNDLQEQKLQIEQKLKNLQPVLNQKKQDQQERLHILSTFSFVKNHLFIYVENQNGKEIQQYRVLLEQNQLQNEKENQEQLYLRQQINVEQNSNLVQCEIEQNPQQIIQKQSEQINSNLKNNQNLANQKKKKRNGKSNYKLKKNHTLTVRPKLIIKRNSKKISQQNDEDMDNEEDE